MNKLENLIWEKREDFNDLNPSDGHFERFQERLSTRKLNQFNFLRIASVLIIGLLIAAVSIYSIRSFTSNHRIYASQENDLDEVLYYYSGMNSELEEQINEMNFEYSSEKEELLSDIKSYDEGLEKIEEDLKNFPNDERVRNAAISHHKGKTALLNIIISQ